MATQPIARMRDWMARQRRSTLIFGGVLAVAILGVAFIGVAQATDQPAFCRVCHEMRPYNDSWAQGPHQDVSCVECHVDAGAVARLSHKFVALGEVVSHLQGDTEFPRASVEPIPDERCKRCHKQVDTGTPDFDHALHAARGPCEKCHPTAGHSVSVAALKAAGIYSGESPRYDESIDASSIAIVDAGLADLPGHVTVFCSRCHLMTATGCPACHKPPHEPRGECVICHAPGIAFVFAHPENRSDCQTCHTKSATHTTIPGACDDCHKQPGVAWTFKHAGESATCTRCHTRPAKHDAGQCSRCHSKTGVSWAFSHPSSSNCARCHKAPARHYGSGCSSCHSAGRAWSRATFSHPGIRGGEHSYRSFACSSCHPRGYSSATCTKCHSSASGPSDDDDD